MEENSNYLEDVILPLFQTVHFYAAMIVGWWLFHIGIYPFAYFAKGAGADLAAQLPIYAINVMAFGCLVYVATRPAVLLATAVFRGIEKAVAKSAGVK
jgi:hypothetical protein